MKKLITLTMVLALSVAFTAGCKKKEEVATEPAPTTTEAPKPVQAPMSATAGAATEAPAAAPAEAPKH